MGEFCFSELEKSKKISMELESLKYPAGAFKMPAVISDNDIKNNIETIASFPRKLSQEIISCSIEGLHYKYRPGGWTIKQVANHVVDSHMNGVFRFKLALTEDTPTIKPYKEAQWADLPDTLNYNIEDTLHLLESVHKRWEFLLRNMSASDFERKFYHPEAEQTFKLKEYLSLYAWHCDNHLGHVKNAKKFQYQ